MWAGKCSKATETSIRVLWLDINGRGKRKSTNFNLCWPVHISCSMENVPALPCWANSQQEPNMKRNNQSCNISKGGLATSTAFSMQLSGSLQCSEVWPHTLKGSLAPAAFRHTSSVHFSVVYYHWTAQRALMLTPAAVGPNAKQSNRCLDALQTIKLEHEAMNKIQQS